MQWHLVQHLTFSFISGCWQHFGCCICQLLDMTSFLPCWCWIWRFEAGRRNWFAYGRIHHEAAMLPPLASFWPRAYWQWWVNGFVQSPGVLGLRLLCFILLHLLCFEHIYEILLFFFQGFKCLVIDLVHFKILLLLMFFNLSYGSFFLCCFW